MPRLLSHRCSVVWPQHRCTRSFHAVNLKFPYRLSISLCGLVAFSKTAPKTQHAGPLVHFQKMRYLMESLRQTIGYPHESHGYTRAAAKLQHSSVKAALRLGSHNESHRNAHCIPVQFTSSAVKSEPIHLVINLFIH